MALVLFKKCIFCSFGRLVPPHNTEATHFWSWFGRSLCLFGPIFDWFGPIS